MFVTRFRCNGSYDTRLHSGCSLRRLATCYESASLKLQVAAYVSLSRVRLMQRIHILQPFSPLLFNRGAPTGPDRLIRKLKGEMTAHQAMEEWLEFGEICEGEGEDAARDPLKSKHLCASCALQVNPISGCLHVPSVWNLPKIITRCI